MRSQTIQFGWFTPEEATAMLAKTQQSGDSVGDRIALRRRAEYPLPAPCSLDGWTQRSGTRRKDQ